MESVEATTRTQIIYQLLGQLLEYPAEGLAEKARASRQLLAPLHPEAARAMADFVAHVETAPLAAMEELYTRTFDLNPTCSPYVGYHLFGDNFKRGAFLVMLQETFRTHGLDAGAELADHLALLLKLLARLGDDELASDLKTECLVPVLEKMQQSLGAGGDNAYQRLIEATSHSMGGGTKHV